jgi:hypothetical protein
LAEEAFTLDTMCACGHPRRGHRGLRMEVAGPCLECGCAEFSPAGRAPRSQGPMVQEIRARIDQVERLKKIVLMLHAQLDGEG